MLLVTQLNNYSKCLDFANVYYHPQRSWSKVIFSQASVILSTGGVCSRGGPGSGGVPAPRGMPAPGGCLVLGVPGGEPPGAATAAGGTRPNGKHSCPICFYRPQMKLQEGNVFISICLSFCSGGAHVTITHDALGPAPIPLLLISGGHHLRPVQTCSLEDPPSSPFTDI